MGFSLLNSIFAYGLFAVSIPIIIHFLFKRQFKTIKWAAIHYLQEAEKRVRKRLRLIELFLLMLRCLAIILFILLFGRLILDQSGNISKSFGGKASFYYFVIDNSPSMKANDGFGNPLSRIKKEAIAFIKNECDKNQENFLTIILSSNPKAPILKKILLSLDNLEVIKKSISDIETKDQSLKIDELFNIVQNNINKKKSEFNQFIYLFSDFRDSDWLASGSKKINKSIASFAGNSNKLILIDAGKAVYNNVSISNVTLNEKRIIVNVPIKFEVEIKNLSSTVKSDIIVDMSVNDSIPMKKSIPSLSVGETKHVIFSYSFNKVGNYEIKYEIDDDDFNSDNQRYYSVEVKQGNKILIIDGSTSQDITNSESYFIKTAITPPGEMNSGHQIIVKSESEFNSTSLNNYEVIYLCNLYRLSQEKINEIEDWVNEGGSLIFTLGDQIDDNFYNDYLFKDGGGILPAKLNSIEQLKEGEFSNFVDLDFNHPMFSIFNQEASKIILNTRFYRWWNVEVKNKINTNILGYFQNDSKTPAFIEKTIGRGKVFLYTSTIDDDWNSWPTELSYIVTHLELVRYCLLDKSNENVITTGDPIILNTPTTIYKPNAGIKLPNVDSFESIKSVAGHNNNEYSFKWLNTQMAGFYKFQLNSYKGEIVNKSYSANIDKKESLLEQGKLKSSLNNSKINNLSFISLEEFKDSDEKVIVEFWKIICIILVTVLLLESIVAWYFGGKR
ncbi:MAG: hypothetical protein COA79_13560 [Planctomycetota bacterium]|nr:MAG: hypothetical protein COA79_13560 [Planctomycetota bacterium]